jgi:peptide deformylase
MALRNIVREGDEILRKKSKDVTNFGERIHVLLDDMWETMQEYDGVGLAAPQVAVLRRAIVVDATDLARDEAEADAPESEQEGQSADDQVPDDRGQAPENAAEDAAEDAPVLRYELINPVILESEGEATEKEGCLSLPGVVGVVKRPARVKVRAMDRNGQAFIVEGEGLLAKALCHEIDHLEGILFTDKAESIERPEDT